MFCCMPGTQHAINECLLKEWHEWIRGFKMCLLGRYGYLVSLTAPVPYINLYICAKVWMAQYLWLIFPFGVRFWLCMAEGQKLDSSGITEINHHVLPQGGRPAGLCWNVLIILGGFFEIPAIFASETHTPWTKLSLSLKLLRALYHKGYRDIF